MTRELKIVDISKKENVHRYSTCRAILRIYENHYKVIEKYVKDIENIIKRSIKVSWLYIPLLHPLPINDVHTDIEVSSNKVVIEVSASTIYKTGIEMDVLFSTICAISYIYHILWLEKIHKYPHVDEVRIIEKVKRELANVENTFFNNIEDFKIKIPLRYEKCSQCIEKCCIGSLRLRRSTIDVVLRGQTEKGDPVSISKVVCVEACKRFIEILQEPIPQILASRCTLDIRNNDVHVVLSVKFCNNYNPGSVIFGVLCGLGSFLDVVKKYEKDSSGNYPDTSIHDVYII